MCRKNRLRIESCQPFFIDQFNRHCHNLSENALIAVIDADNCVVSTFQNGAWLGIRSIHLQKNDLKEELSVLLKREALLHGLSEPYLVYLLSPKNPDPEWMSAEKMTYYPTELFHEADREISLGTLKSILKKCVPSKFSFFKS
jgi:hypothetical protein